MNLNVALLLVIVVGGFGGIAAVQAALGRSADRRGHTPEVAVHSLV
ncbi:hypothetical protein [Rhodococcus zopfii]|nr:hypothetical protein [Rhodococcus zopfii]